MIFFSFTRFMVLIYTHMYTLWNMGPESINLLMLAMSIHSYYHIGFRCLIVLTQGGGGVVIAVGLSIIYPNLVVEL